MPRNRPTAARIHDARRHAKARASARLGLVLNTDDLRAVVSDIQGGRSTHLWNQSLTRVWHLLHVRGIPCVVVYGKSTKTAHTFLTLEQARETLEKHGQVEALGLLRAT